MNPCEFFEVEISALLDGEVSPDAALETVDHLLACDGCRQFYRGARRVEGLLADVEAGRSADGLPPRLWARIEGSARRPGAAPPEQTREPVPSWAGRVAAVLVLAVGAAVVAGLVLLTPGADSERVIELEGRSGVMTDARFVTIATELLQADRQYQMKMEQIMAAVNRYTFTPEGSGERGLPVETPDRELLRASSEPGRDSESSARVWY